MHHSEMCQPCGDCEWCRHRHALRHGRDRWRTLAKSEHAKLERLRLAARHLLDAIATEYPGEAEKRLRSLLR